MVVHRSTQPYMFHALFAQYFVTMQCLLAAVGSCDVHLFKHLHLYLDITIHNPAGWSDTLDYIHVFIPQKQVFALAVFGTKGIRFQVNQNTGMYRIPRHAPYTLLHNANI